MSKGVQRCQDDHTASELLPLLLNGSKDVTSGVGLLLMGKRKYMCITSSLLKTTCAGGEPNAEGSPGRDQEGAAEQRTDDQMAQQPGTLAAARKHQLV